MKKGLLAILIAVLMIGLLGCSSDEEPTENVETGISEEETIVVGTNADFPPFEFVEVVDGEQTYVGFDMDLIHEIGNELGINIQIEDMDFNGLVGAIQSNRIDLAIAGMAVNEERLEKVDFSDPYFETTQTIIAKEEVEDIEHMDQLNGKEVAAQLGSTSYDAIVEFEDINTKQLNQVTDAILEVENGMVDALIVEEPIAKAFMEENPGLKMFVPEGLNEEADSFAIAIAKGQEELLKDINEALQSIKDSGKYDELIAKWFE